jgi:hypothetical protein
MDTKNNCRPGYHDCQDICLKASYKGKNKTINIPFINMEYYTNEPISIDGKEQTKLSD